MNKFILYIFFVIVSCNLFAQDKGLLSTRYTVQELQQRLIPQSQWTPFPKLNDQEGWAKANQEALQSCIKEAESRLDYEWKPLPASIYRTWPVYDRLTLQKRSALKSLILGEMVEQKGRFLDQIMNGIWSICEETWWGTPATIPQIAEYAGLMDVTQPVVELWSSETGVLFAWADYFLGDRLDSVSPLIRKRMHYEIEHRLFKPFMEKDHWWMGKRDDGQGPNNWNPWICSNWINTVLLLVKDDNERAVMIDKALKVLDEFIDPYAHDGGCDEGPGYWMGAAGMMYCCFSILNLASNDAFQYVYDNERIKNMGRYIYQSQINEEYFLNFADAEPKISIDAGLVYRYGRDIKDQNMIKFGAYYREEKPRMVSTHFFLNFFDLFGYEELLKAPQGLPFPGDVWFADMQVMAARDKNGSTGGFYLAAKGGHNAESHNHNDVGMFVVYYDGQPLIIDVGRATYTPRTLNNTDKRYELWMHRSDFHNLPTINGINQLVGITQKASNVSYKADKNTATLSLDVSKAYPEEACIDKLERTIQLKKGKYVQLTDNISLSKANSITEYLVTCHPAEVKKPGEVIIHYVSKDGTNKDFIVEYNPAQLEASVEKVGLEIEEDAIIKQSWGDNIRRINFKVIAPKTKDSFAFKIRVL